MKRFLAFAVLMFAIGPLSAQDLQGEIRYNTFVDLSKQIAILDDPSASLDRKREAENTMRLLKNIYEHSYTLSFNKYESFFKKDEKLSVQENGGQAIDALHDYYKNFKENIYITKRDISGHIYFLSEQIKKFDWKLEDETKTIGKYTCQKASYSVMQDQAESIQKADGSFEQKIIPKKVTFTAWYTLQIPIMNGPSEYGGLPGLILEVSNDTDFLSIKCTEINLDPKKEVKIKRPGAKRMYTEKEYWAELDRLIRGG